MKSYRGCKACKPQKTSSVWPPSRRPFWMPPRKTKRSSSFSGNGLTIVPMEAHAMAATGGTAQILKSQGLWVFPQSWTVDSTEAEAGVTSKPCVEGCFFFFFFLSFLAMRVLGPGLGPGTKKPMCMPSMFSILYSQLKNTRLGTLLSSSALQSGHNAKLLRFPSCLGCRQEIGHH